MGARANPAGPSRATSLPRLERAWIRRYKDTQPNKESSTQEGKLNPTRKTQPNKENSTRQGKLNPARKTQPDPTPGSSTPASSTPASSTPASSRPSLAGADPPERSP